MANKKFFVDIDLNGQQLVNAGLEKFTSLPSTGTTGRIIHLQNGEVGTVYVETNSGSTNVWVAQATQAYVDQSIQASTPTANNGLTVSGQTIQLGGNLTKDTTINATGYSFAVTNASGVTLNTTNGTESTTFSLTPLSTTISSSDVNDTAFLGVTSTEVALIHTFSNSGTSVAVSNGSVVISGETIGFGGAKYADNYGVNFTDRSLVDKAFVSGLTTGLSGQIAAVSGYTTDVATSLQSHINQTGATNPHQTALNNLSNVTISSVGQNDLLIYVSGSWVNANRNTWVDGSQLRTDFGNHTGDTLNPHNTTLTQVLSANTSASFQKITNLGEGSNPSDAATVGFVNNIITSGVLWQAPVKDIVNNLPTGLTAANNGDRYISGFTGSIYQWSGGTSWKQITPSTGWTVWVVDDIDAPTNDRGWYNWNGTTWIAMNTSLAHNYSYGLQGGDSMSSQYYHMTSAQWMALTDGDGFVDNADGQHSHTVGGSNGLTSTGQGAKLGGALSESTNITTSGNSLTIEGTGSISISTTDGVNPHGVYTTQGSLELKGGNTNNNIILSGGTGIHIKSQGATDGIKIESMGSMLQVSDTGMVVTGFGSFTGITYAGDYSTDFTNRSLVDKGYVDNKVSGATNSAGNGINITSNVISVVPKTGVTGYVGVTVDSGGVSLQIDNSTIIKSGSTEAIMVANYAPVAGTTVTRTVVVTGVTITTSTGGTTLTHNLNNKYPEVKIYDSADDTEVEINVKAVNTNDIKLISNVAFTAVVVIQG